MDPPLQQPALPEAPRARAYLHDGMGTPPNILLQATFPAPFYQTDWPVPQPPRQREVAGFVGPQFPLWVNPQYLGFAVVTSVAPRWSVSISFN